MWLVGGIESLKSPYNQSRMVALSDNVFGGIIGMHVSNVSYTTLYFYRLRLINDYKGFCFRIVSLQPDHP